MTRLEELEKELAVATRLLTAYKQLEVFQAAAKQQPPLGNPWPPVRATAPPCSPHDWLLQQA